jgi:hypothetical protein
MVGYGMMTRVPEKKLLDCLVGWDPRVAEMMLALREIVLEEAPDAVESLVKTYAVSIGFSFTGKPLKDGFCHVVAYATHVNLGFNRGAEMADPSRVLEGKGKSIRHVTFRKMSELERPFVRPYLQAATEMARKKD